MIQIEARLSELSALGIQRRTRLVSGPQGPHVVLDGKPVLLLCSDNYLALADHPRVREAAADAATRWGVGCGSSRVVSGTMTIHRRLEERLAQFHRRECAVLFGSGYLAAAGAVAALARPGDVVFCDELSHTSVVDGCRLSQAEVFVYDHCDVEHLAWGVEQAQGRGALIATESLFSSDGVVAPLEEILEVAQLHGLRLLVDEGHATGTTGPGGRGLVAATGLEDEVDVVVGTLGNALGSHGGFVTCHRLMARYLQSEARTFTGSGAPAPPAVAAALAALEHLQERPRLVDRLQANSRTLRAELAREGFDPADGGTHIVAIVLDDAQLAREIADSALERGVYVHAGGPSSGLPVAPHLRLTVMASHQPEELRAAARILGQAAKAAGIAPRAPAPTPLAIADPEPLPRTAGVFDFEARAA
jgi:glycine C-acetyltransferase/8-amino-7-oxononanoate synthase